MNYKHGALTLLSSALPQSFSTHMAQYTLQKYNNYYNDSITNGNVVYILTWSSSAHHT